MSRQVHISEIAAHDFDRDPQNTVKEWHSKYGTHSLSPIETANSITIKTGKRVLAILI